MRRGLLLMISLVAAFALSILPVGSSAASDKGVCKQGGFLGLARSDGTRFKNQGQCVSYAVHGGTLLRGTDASSVFTEFRGAGGPAGPPDANGDSRGGSFDSGAIAGAFSGAPLDGFNFVMFFDYVLHNGTGLADGTGTASCDPCSVGGRSGTISFTTTVVGHSFTANGLQFVTYDSGSWRIASATGDLTGISGTGTWTQTGERSRAFAGTVFSPL